MARSVHDGWDPCLIELPVQDIDLDQLLILLDDASSIDGEEPPRKKQRREEQDDQLETPVLEHITRIRPTKAGKDKERREKLFKLAEAGPTTLGEVQLQVERVKSTRRNRPDTIKLHVRVKDEREGYSGDVLFSFDGPDDILVATLACAHVHLIASLRVEQVDKIVNFALHASISLAAGFFDLTYPTTSVSSRHAFISAAFPSQASREQALASLGPASIAHYANETDLELFYASLRPPAQRISRKGKERADAHEDLRLKPRGLIPTLMPFQQRSVRWMLGREGVRLKQGDAREVTEIEALSPIELENGQRPLFWEAVGIDEERIFYVNRVTGEVVRDEGEIERRKVSDYRGGMLCEEMGLGKTIEVVSLILLNRQDERDHLPSYWDEQLASDVQPSSISLIIAPAAIVGQWHSELVKHSPGLRVFRYESIKKLPKGFDAAQLADDYDIVLTTFDVLRAETAFARKPVQRSMRSASGNQPRYTYRRSLLIELEFARVIMDEPQMGANAQLIAEMCSLIRRQFSWAVSGTPLKARIGDLRGLLRFLRVEPCGSDPGALARLVSPGGVAAFVDLFSRIGIRTLKADVNHELTIPPQSRYIVPLDFGPVEDFAYKQRYAEAMVDLGLTVDGKAPSADWRPDAIKMRFWLGRLRQLCCNQAVNTGPGPTKLQTLSDVLDAMREANLTSLEIDQRARCAAIVRRGHLTLYDHETCGNIESAIEVFDGAIELLRPLSESIRTQIRAMRKRAREERAKRDASAEASNAASDADDFNFFVAKADAEAENTLLKASTPEERALSKKLSTLSNRLRDVMDTMHAATFYRASAFFQLGKFPKEEQAGYDEAEQIRKEVLAVDLHEAEKRIKQLKDRVDEKNLQIKDLEVRFNTKERPGISTAGVWEEIAETSDRLNGIAELLWDWREELNTLLCRPIRDDEDDITGEEYETGAELQEQLDNRLEIYQMLVADWREALTGDRSSLADNVGLSGAAQAAKQFTDDAEVFEEGSKRARRKLDRMGAIKKLPEFTAAEKLRKRLLLARAKTIGLARENSQVKSLRRLAGELSEIRRDAIREEEIAICDAELKRVRKQIADREEAYKKLSTELTVQQSAFNSRVAYYAALQVLSDAVAVIDTQAKAFKGVEAELTVALDTELRHMIAYRAKDDKRRYLENLVMANEMPETARECTICRETDYKNGVVTHCGHVFCEVCWAQCYRLSKSCPTCKRVVKAGDYQKVVIRASGDVEMQDGTITPDSSVMELDDAETLNKIPSELMDAVAVMPTKGELGTKIDTLTRHIKYIRQQDPEAKVVVFTAWKAALEVLRLAFALNDIRFVQLEGGAKAKKNAAKTFAEDDDTAAFLLHSESSAAGLNLIAASTIILVEPLLHPSTELQAVGRVDRIGQRKQTTVYQYCVRDTPDERIANLAVRKRTSLFTEAAIRRATAIEGTNLVHDLQSGTAGETAAEDEDDLVATLFAPQERKTIQACLMGDLSATDNAAAMDVDEQVVAQVELDARRLRAAQAAEARHASQTAL